MRFIGIISDVGSGWSKVKYEKKTYYIINSNLSKALNLSRFTETTVKTNRLARAVKGDKLAKVPTKIPKNSKINSVGLITGGKYKGYKLIVFSGKLYYLKAKL